MPSRVAFMLRALRYRNYRLFFGGQIVSLIGSWITLTATSWLVYRLTGSALLLGVVGFAGQFPGFVFGAFAGAYVDRLDRHKILVWTQSISMVQSFILAGLTLTDHITVPAIVALNAVQGVVNAFDMPARQAFLVNIITDKEDLANAIALNSSMFNAARLVGPSIAGVVIAASNEGICFLIDGFSYFAVLIALLSMRGLQQQTRRVSTSVISQFTDGLRYVYTFRPIRSLMLLVAVVSLLGIPYSVLMPVFADDVLKGGSNTLGLLMTATGGGALMGALWLTTRSVPSAERRPPSAARIRAFCSAVSESDSSTPQTASTLVSTLFTFCPPGPPDRDVRKRISWSGGSTRARREAPAAHAARIRESRRLRPGRS